MGAAGFHGVVNRIGEETERMQMTIILKEKLYRHRG